MVCDICSRPMAPAVCAWTYRCARCGLWQSTLAAAINAETHQLDEHERARALRNLRAGNFHRIFERLARLAPERPQRVLDVGCAYGWFLEEAASRGLTAVGIEPDRRTAAIARARGHDVIEGYFPEALPDSASFDVIVFNDVLEHLPDVHGMLAASAARLSAGGFLVLSIPVSSGTLFTAARMMARLGWIAPWRRLWQATFPSPHVYYFNRTNLGSAAESHGFSCVERGPLDVFQPRGLWSRLRFDRRRAMMANLALYAALIALYPIYRALGRPDTEMLIYRYEGRVP
jgi:SAM-dependent methyltransferase